MTTSKPIFETSRFLLRELTPDDASDLYRLNLDFKVIKYTGDVAFTSVKEARTFLEKYDHYRLYNMGRWAVICKTSSNFVGWCGLKTLLPQREVDVGYRFLGHYWGNGIATETARASLKHGFSQLNLDRIVAQAAVENSASLRVLEKIGMKIIGKTEIGSFEALKYEITRSDFLSL
jgi:RimJ/RimL family protein N-acetyltransferase